MRTVDVLRVVSPLLAVVAVALLGTRRRLIRRFQDASACAPDRAIAFSGSGRALSAWWMARLLRAGVVRPLADGRYWLDQGTWHAYRRARRHRAIAIAAALVIIVVLVIASGGAP